MLVSRNMKVSLQVLLLCVVAVYSGPTLYRLNEQEAEEVKIPVSSTGRYTSIQVDILVYRYIY